MAGALFRPQRTGLRRLGETYFPDFSSAGAARGIDELLAALGRGERVQVHLALWLAAVVPRSAIRLLARSERATAPRPVRRFVAPVHAQLKALCAILYFAQQDPRRHHRRCREIQCEDDWGGPGDVRPETGGRSIHGRK